MLGMIEKTSFVMLLCLHIAYCAYFTSCKDDPGCEKCSTTSTTECELCHVYYYSDINNQCRYCKYCISSRKPPATPPPPPPPPQGGCFPGSSMVSTLTGNVAMETLNIGDSVLTVLGNEEMKFTKVVGFAQREPDKDIEFLSITTVNQAGHTQTVKLTATHNIYVKTKMDGDHDEYIPRFAKDVSTGDVLKTQTDNGKALNEAIVTHVTLHKEMGAFAPMTETGTMLVDGTLVSCYASFNDYLSHLVLAPIRWFPWLFADEVKPLDGRLPYVETVKYIARNYVAPIISFQ